MLTPLLPFPSLFNSFLLPVQFLPSSCSSFAKVFLKVSSSLFLRAEIPYFLEVILGRFKDLNLDHLKFWCWLLILLVSMDIILKLYNIRNWGLSRIRLS